jgi:MerR family mercuric resistance operon transcriptional regulator
MAEVFPDRMPHLTIGRLSRRTGCGVETIRYYERVGLVPAPARSEGGHRLYTDREAQRLAFIRRSRDLGFTLDEVRSLLGLMDRGDYSCAQVQTIAQGHLEDVRARQRDLARMAGALEELVASCEGGASPDCAILEALSG